MEAVNTSVTTLWATLVALVTLGLKWTAMDSTVLVTKPTQISSLMFMHYKIIFFTDIDECALNQSKCLSNSTCVNTEGNYTCPCDTGFAGDGFTGCESECCYHV